MPNWLFNVMLLLVLFGLFLTGCLGIAYVIELAELSTGLAAAGGLLLGYILGGVGMVLWRGRDYV